MEPRTAWEHCDLGRSYLRSGDFARAAEQFRIALDLRPQDFWTNFDEGLCAYHLGRFDEAVNAFRVCIALDWKSAECYFNRALAHEALGHAEQALRDYTWALGLNEKFTEAALNRGILHYGAGRYAEAAADLDRALENASGREILGVIHYNRALVELARGDRPAALASLGVAQAWGTRGPAASATASNRSPVGLLRGRPGGPFRGESDGDSRPPGPGRTTTAPRASRPRPRGGPGRDHDVPPLGIGHRSRLVR